MQECMNFLSSRIRGARTVQLHRRPSVVDEGDS